LFADRQVRARAGDDFGLLREFGEDRKKRRFRRTEVVPIEEPQSLLKSADCRKRTG